MDIIDFWSRQIEKWNADNKCGLCWSFAAPLEESQANVQQLTEEGKCCVQAFITDVEFEKGLSYNNSTRLVTSEYCDYNFNLFLLMSSELGRNNYNEINSYPIDQSKWETIFKPIHDCLGCEAIIDFCEVLGYEVEIIKWKAKTKHNYLSMNYDGWIYNITFRVYP